jgi:hypothetical protein
MPQILMSQLLVLFLGSVKDVFGLVSFLTWRAFVFFCFLGGVRTGSLLSFFSLVLLVCFCMRRAHHTGERREKAYQPEGDAR